MTVNNYSLSSAREITAKPVKKRTRYSNTCKSVEELTVRDSIKRLGEVKEHCSNRGAFV